MPKTVEKVKTVEYLMKDRIAAFHGKEAELIDRVFPVLELTVDKPVLASADEFGVSLTAPEGKLFRCVYDEDKATVDCQVY